MTDPITLHTVLAEYERQRQADRDHTRLSASGNDPLCDRQTALRLAGTEPSDPTEPVTAATVGTLIHLGMTEVWTQVDPDAYTEQRGEHGTADVVHHGDLLVRDLKTVNQYVFDQWAEAGGPPEGVWNQLRIYAHDNDAAPGWQLVVDALCRDDGRCATYTRPYHPTEGEDAVADLGTLGEALGDPDQDPWQVEPTGAYGPDWVCERCPFRTPCGRGTRPRDVAPPLDDPTITEAVADYLHAKELEAEAKRLKGRAKVALRGVEGTVDGYAVKWVTRRGLPERVLPPTEPSTYLSVRKAKK